MKVGSRRVGEGEESRKGERKKAGVARLLTVLSTDFTDDTDFIRHPISDLTAKKFIPPVPPLYKLKPMPSDFLAISQEGQAKATAK